jgi:hypothetical protein
MLYPDPRRTVSDENHPPSSGSRWEQADVVEPGTPVAETPGAPPIASPAAWETHPAGSTYPAAPPRSSRLRTRAALVGAGAALAVAGGVGGFVLGQQAASTDVHQTSVVRGTDPGQGDGDGLPGRPGFGDREARPDFGGDGGSGGAPGEPGSDDGTTDDGTT